MFISWAHENMLNGDISTKKGKKKNKLRLGLISKSRGQRIVIVLSRVRVQFYEKNMLREYIKIIDCKIVNAVRCQDFAGFFFSILTI